MTTMHHGATHGAYDARRGLAPASSVSPMGGSSIHETSWSPYERNPARDVVLLLLDDQAPFGAPALRAVQLARHFDADVHVVVATRDEIAGLARISKKAMIGKRLARATWHRGLPIELVQGELGEAGQIAARNYSPKLVVVGADARGIACELAEAFVAPVLVVREASPSGAGCQEGTP